MRLPRSGSRETNSANNTFQLYGNPFVEIKIISNFHVFLKEHRFFKGAQTKGWQNDISNYQHKTDYLAP